MSEMVESFKRDLAGVSWRELKIHLQRDAIIIISAEIDLIEAAIAVAEDDKIQVEVWIDAGHLAKPTEKQLGIWEQEEDKPFQMLIVQPFILIQEIVHA